VKHWNDGNVYFLLGISKNLFIIFIFVTKSFILYFFSTIDM